MNVFGLDIGGSAIKGALVDASTGEMLTERVRIKTPQPSTSGAVLETCAEVVSQGDWSGPVGCGFPGVVKGGVIQTSANLDDSNIGFDLRGELRQKLGDTVQVVNDADAAGLAEVRWGAGREVDGVMLMLTLGTGIGSALFVGDTSCRTPNSDIWRSAVTTPRPAPPTAPESARTWVGNNTRSGWTST